MDDSDKTLLSDPNSDAYKEFKTNVEKRKTDADKQYKTIESLQAARKERVKEVISSESHNTEFKELEHDVSVLTQGANDGEIIKNKEDSGYGFRLHSVLGALGMREADSAPRCWSESSLKITSIGARG